MKVQPTHDSSTLVFVARSLFQQMLWATEWALDLGTKLTKMSTSADVSAGLDNVRQRTKASSVESASGKPKTSEAVNGEPRTDKTYGRTPGGTGT